jgi:hypothetical protein
MCGPLTCRVFFFSQLFARDGIIPPDTLLGRVLLAVVRSQIGSSPSADGAAAAALDILKNFVSLKAIDRQLALTMAWPVAFAPAQLGERLYRRR